MKKLAPIVLVLLFLASLFLFLRTKPSAKSFAQYCPIDSIAYLEMPEPSSSLQKAKSLSIHDLFTSQGMKAILGKDRMVDEAYRTIDVLLQTFTEVFKERGKPCGPISLVVPFLAEGDLSMMLAFNTENPQELVTSFLSVVRIFEEKLKAELPNKSNSLSFSVTDISCKFGVMVKAEGMEIDDNRPVFFAFNDFLVFSQSKTSAMRFIQEAEAKDKMRLDKNPNFVNIKKSVAGRDLTSYVNVTALVNDIKSHGEEVPPLVFDLFGYGGQGNTFDGKDMSSELSVYANRPASYPFLADLQGKSLKMPYLKYFPADALAVAAVNLPSIQSVYSLLSRWPNFQHIEESLSRETGMSLSQELFGSFGTEMGACYRTMGMQEFLFAVELRDPDTIVRFLEVLCGIKDANVAKTTFNGNNLYTFREMPPAIMASALVKDGLLLLGTNLLLKAALGMGEKDSILSSKPFKQAMGKMNATSQNVLIYADTQRALQTLAAFVSIEARTDMSWISDSFADSGPFAFTMKFRDDGFSCRCTGPCDTSLLSVTALAIPTLFTSRRYSNDSMALGTCMSFGAAAIDFANSNVSNYFWESNTLDFSPYFSHVSIKGGYLYTYFSDDVIDDGVHEGTRFIYFAVPVSTSSGAKAYWIDESQSIYVSEGVLTAADIEALRQAMVDFEAEAGSPERMPVDGVWWERY